MLISQIGNLRLFILGKSISDIKLAMEVGVYLLDIADSEIKREKNVKVVFFLMF